MMASRVKIPARVFQECFENRKFVRGKLDGLAADFHLVEFWVQLYSVARDRRSSLLRARLVVAQLRLDSRQQDARAERLCDVVVRAEFKPAYDVRLLASCGKHDNRHLRVGFLRAVDFAEVQPVHARQHEVEQNEVEAFALFEPRERLFGGIHARALVAAFFDVEFDKLSYAFLVLDY